MKKAILILITGISIINTSCQDDNFLSHFPEIKNDSIIDTRENLNNYYYIFKERTLSEKVALEYIFNNDSNKMHAIFESYNMDEDKYTYEPYTKNVSPLFKKKFDSLYLLHYSIDSELFLAIYNEKIDTIVQNFKVADFSDELGNVVTHSIIFPNNYIAKTQINNNVNYELVKINYDILEFKVLKTIEANNINENQNKIFENIFSVLGITNSGEPLE